MFDWFAARPPRPEEPMRDRPTIPLTAEERLAFESLTRPVERRARFGSVLASWSRSVGGWRGLPLGLALLVAGGVWCIAWLTTSVPVSFAGVLAQAAGGWLVIESQRVRLQRGGSAAPAEASPQQPHAQRRRGL